MTESAARTDDSSTQPLKESAEPDEIDEIDDHAHGSFWLKDRFRFFLIVLALVCLTSVSANAVAYNQLIVCISGTAKRKVESHPYVYYSYEHQKWLYMAVALGSMGGTFLYSLAYNKLGLRYVFGLTGVLSAVCAGLSPWMAQLGFPWFMAVRIVQGFTYSSDFAAIGVLITKWSPLNRSAMTVSLLTAYSSLSSLITFWLNGPACQSFAGWPIMYYGLCAFGLVSFGLWFFFYTDYPVNSRFVSDEEFKVLKKGKLKQEMGKAGKVPYLKILTSPVAWAVWANAFAELNCTFFMYQYIGRYMVSVLNFDLQTAGIMAGLPVIPYVPLRIIIGYVNDKITFIGERLKMVLFNCICIILPAFFVGAVGFIDSTHRYWAVFCFVMTYVCYAFSGGAFYKCAHLMARQHSSFVIAVVQFLKCLTLFAGPALFDFTVKEQEDRLERWRAAFLTIAAILLAAGILFIFFGTDKPQKFTREPQKEREEGKSGEDETEPSDSDKLTEDKKR